MIPHHRGLIAPASAAPQWTLMAGHRISGERRAIWLGRHRWLGSAARRDTPLPRGASPLVHPRLSRRTGAPLDLQRPGFAFHPGTHEKIRGLDNMTLGTVTFRRSIMGSPAPRRSARGFGDYAWTTFSGSAKRRLCVPIFHNTAVRRKFLIATQWDMKFYACTQEPDAVAGHLCDRREKSA